MGTVQEDSTVRLPLRTVLSYDSGNIATTLLTAVLSIWHILFRPLYNVRLCICLLPAAQLRVYVRGAQTVALQSVGTGQYLAIKNGMTTFGTGGKFCNLIVKEVGE